MKSKARSILIGVVAGFFPQFAQGVTIIDAVDDPLIDPQMYRDEAALFPSVGKVSGSGLSGSGVLISDRWVLTAGHVSLSKTGGNFVVGGTTYSISSAITYPSFTFSGPAYDIGLLYLDAPVTGVENAAMFRFADPAAVLGMEATWVGYGLSGTGKTGAQAPMEFRAFTNFIDVFGGTYGLSNTSFVADFDNPHGTSNASSSSPVATRLEGNLASGDSGGGVFVRVEGVPYLVGINSYTGGFVAGSNSKYGSISGAADLQQFYGWIFDQTGVSPVPEPSIPWFVLGAATLFMRRNRNQLDKSDS